MYHRLLTPLDGSPRAEAALPVACRLAEQLRGSLTLIHIIERSSPRQVHGEVHLADGGRAGTYLEGIKTSLPAELQASTHVHTVPAEDVARSLVDHAREFNIDLFVMTCHGAGDLRHTLFGTVAQRVIALGTIPVLLVPASAGKHGRHFRCQRLVIPLDGQPDHEHGLSVLPRFGKDCATDLLLMLVIPTWRHLKQEHQITSRILPGATQELLKLAPEQGRAYLKQKIRDLRGPRRRVDTEVVHGDPVDQILDSARGFKADLIVLGTHGKTHTDAFWSESVTPKLLRQSQVPVLLVPID